MRSWLRQLFRRKPPYDLEVRLAAAIRKAQSEAYFQDQYLRSRP